MESINEEPTQAFEDGCPLSLLAYDSSAALLTVGNGGTIQLRDIRQELISGEWPKDFGEANNSSGLPSSRTLSPQPLLGVRAVQLSVSHDGAYAATGGTDTEDSDVAAVALLDLTFRRPAPRDGRGAERCECAHVDEEHFRSRPGLRVLQMAWHPGSSTHLAILTSDNTWQLYHAGNLSHPEQRFELRLQRRRGVGVDGGEGRRAVAFAFGPQHLWQRFTVFIMCSDGTLFSLCPVAPFGAGVPASVVQALTEAASDSDDCFTTQAWLQQALSGPVSERENSVASGVVSVQRHALDEHAPALSGPLAVACAEGPAGSFLEWTQEEDKAVSLCAIWFGGAATVLVAASANGLLGAHLLAEDICPVWAESAPLCLTDDVLLLGVRSEVPVVDEAPATLLLVDLVDLQMQPARADEADSEQPGPSAVHLLSDEAAPERLFVRTQSAAWTITLSWLPALANFLAEDREALQDVAQLPPPRVEELFTTEPGNAIVGACVMGDALTGTALVLLTSDGSHHCLRPSGSLPADQQPTGEEEGSQAARELEEQVQQLYGALLRGPKGQRHTEGLSLSVSSPEGTKALGEGIGSLLERHVEFIHQGHHHLLPRADELKQAGEAQLHQLERLTDLYTAVQQSQASLVARLDRAARLHANLQSRVKLLAELHHQLPRPLSIAEMRVRDVTIPDAEASLEELQRSVQSARRQWAAISSKAQRKSSARAATAAAPAPSVPAAQLRRVRAALAEQAALTASAGRALAAMQSWVDAWQQDTGC
ncbi:g1971 [Coccomyxa elongata]